MAGNFIERSRHGTVFYFRRRVPRDLRERLGRCHIYVSLRTEQRRLAILRARLLAVRTDQVFEEIRSMPRKKSDELFRIDFGLHIDLESPSGKPKKIAFTDVKPGEEDAVAALAAKLTGMSTVSAKGDTPTVREALVEVLGSPDLKPTTRKEYSRHGELMAAFFGEDRQLGEIDQAQFAKFAATLRARTDWADKTKNLAMVNCAAIFNFYAGRNPAVPAITTKNLKLKRTRPAGQDRDAFTIDELRVLFTNAARYRATEPAKWWITVATAFLGCRVEELAQAHLAGDFYRDRLTGALVLKITEDADSADAPAKSVKTLAGWRRVPLHPLLEEIGFGDYLEGERKAGSATLFERQWKPWRDPSTGGIKHSHSAVKWGGRELAKLQTSGRIATGKQTYFHSMRHTFATLLAAQGIGEEWRAGLAGQAHGGVNAQVYTKAREDVSQTLPMLTKGLKPLESIVRDVVKVSLPSGRMGGS